VSGRLSHSAGGASGVSLDSWWGHERGFEVLLACPCPCKNIAQPGELGPGNYVQVKLSPIITSNARVFGWTDRVHCRKTRVSESEDVTARLWEFRERTWRNDLGPCFSGTN
jgi:hypothetical protein